MVRAPVQLILVDCGSARAAALADLLRADGASVRQLPLAAANGEQFDDCGAVVISGGPHLFTAPDGAALLRRFAFIRRLAVPTLGICLGHQAMGLAAGARVFRGAQRRGPESISRTRAHALLEGLPDTVSLTADHCEGIDVPAGYTCLAASRYYGNEIMVQPEQRFVGVQAHPESSGETGRRILTRFLEFAQA